MINLVSLVTDQPITNLLPIRALRPDSVLFVGTKREHDTILHLKRLLRSDIDVHECVIYNPFGPFHVLDSIRSKIDDLGWKIEETVFDISGGNKMMAFGVYGIARDGNGQLADLERIGRNFRLRVYAFSDGAAKLSHDEQLSALITVDDYIKAHLPGYKEEGFSLDDYGRDLSEGGLFEETLFYALEPLVDEVLAGVRPAGAGGQIEIDLVIRRGNNVGLVEAKTGSGKRGIDQLDTAGNSHYLGKFSTKFLITGRPLSREHKALAVAQQVYVIELPGYRRGRSLPKRERQILRQRIERTL